MKLRRGSLLALAATLLLAGCVDDAPGSADEGGALADDGVEADGDGVEADGDGVEPDGDAGEADGDGVEPDGDAGGADGDLVPVDREPAVPPLHPVIDDWDETVVSIRTTAGTTPTVDAKVAVTPEERRRGLMEVEQLPEGSGMLFLFEDERTGGFWMRNTLVPLDIAYIDANGVIGTVLAMDPCDEPAASDCPTYVPEEPYVTALEVPRGWFQRVGVAEGDPVAWARPGR